MKTVEKVEPRHVDDFIDSLCSDSYASFVLNWFRAPAIHHAKYGKWMGQFKLFGTYKGTRYRVTGASRLGDVWLSTNFNRDVGYELRVNVDDVSGWGSEP